MPDSGPPMDDVQVKETSKVSFLVYAWGRYRTRTGSIFIDGLVGGMFLSFLMDSEENCADRGFTQVYFYIGLLHFICGIAENLGQYAEEASAEDGVISPMEKWLIWATVATVQVLRVLGVPLLVALGYYILKFSLLENDKWTHERDNVQPAGANASSCTVCYCDRNPMHLAQISLAFQLLLALILVIMWFVMWYVDSDDDEKERLEEKQWRAEETQLSKTWYGKLREAILLIGMHSFFNSGMAGVLLALSVTLPKENCNIQVLSWFLLAGVIFTLTGVINQIQEKVDEMAILDGIVNRAEHRIILTMKFIKFPLFLAELVCFLVIVSEVLINFSHITFEKDTDNSSEHYCEKGLWLLMLAMTGIYGIILVVRILVIIAAICGGSVVEEVEGED